ncbi:hypothetical protein [Flagellimonas nanhaiensis]|uniref:hypothetical protein n=1 Tax=Flagellimonas nanhaiensis TaxID=2292706 RepID=UPI0015F2824B|nr:hypothetical protein [Allomuricauda nanhaiensis]
MKKAVSILAIVAMTMGMISCETDTDVQETVDLFETLDQESTDGHETTEDGRNDN